MYVRVTYRIVDEFGSPRNHITYRRKQPMPGKFELRKSSNGQYHFSLKSGNGERILSSEMYGSKSGAENGIESVKRNAPIEARYERKISTNWQPYFVLKAANNEPIGTSAIFASAIARDNGIESVKHNAPTAQVVDMTV
jgi:uncharacterized protein